MFLVLLTHKGHP